MALICANSLKCSTGLIFRLLSHKTILQKRLQFSTSKILSGTNNETPVKYSTNKASKLEISETLGLKDAEEDKKHKTISRRIILLSFASLLIYFCILREENDLDEILKGNSDVLPKEVQLTQLKLALTYSERNRLPTADLKAKIEELEKDKKIKSPFIK